MVCPRQKNVFRSMDFCHLLQHVEMAIHIRHARKILAGGNQSFPLASNWQANHSMAASPAIQDIQPENVDVPYTPQFLDCGTSSVIGNTNWTATFLNLSSPWTMKHVGCSLNCLSQLTKKFWTAYLNLTLALSSRVGGRSLLFLLLNNLYITDSPFEGIDSRPNKTISLDNPYYPWPSKAVSNTIFSGTTF